MKISIKFLRMSYNYEHVDPHPWSHGVGTENEKKKTFSLVVEKIKSKIEIEI